jgi:hypothetical protein
MSKAGFIHQQRDAQAAYFAHTVPVEAVWPDGPYRLQASERPLNLSPQIRDCARAYFGPPHNIAWHTHASHGLSSQVCCLNFLLPLATNPSLLGTVIGVALGIPAPVMLPVEDGPGDTPFYVGFEWIGRENHLAEWPGAGWPTRGANVTSADAVVRFKHENRMHTLLIEWKYTEKYGAPLRADGNPTRLRRYRDKAFAPDGPIRADAGLKVEDFFWDPFYQMLRQQMLAWRMERAREDGADRVFVLHISPCANLALHRVTAPAMRGFGDDAFQIFRSLLVRPDDFVSRTTEQVFGAALAAKHANPEGAAWAAYLTDRYSFLSSSRSPDGQENR